ncbi:MAG: MOSC domain-containing protein [Gammaproteobacteria bacterium]|nr:MOSC domain-containing protein [Gammaproteobacteria bacterium]MBQ0840570.1 MOSC domain-containing protein [Gammaproteobacteria bacterium]
MGRAQEVIGSIDALWRYPVKSMRGQAIDQAFIGYAGVYGDRLYAFKTSAGPSFSPYLTGRETQDMLLYTPRFRQPEKARQPISWSEAEAISVGITPVYSSAHELAMDVEAPSGEVYNIYDPALAKQLAASAGAGHDVALTHSQRAMTDCRPLSLISLQTQELLEEETGLAIDSRRFRANIHLDLDSGQGFAEDQLIGRSLMLGDKVVITIVERDPRCAMITFDPDSGAATPEILRHITQQHQRHAGIYAAVVVEGLVKGGDPIKLLP